MRDELTAALQARWEESLADEATDGGDGVGEVEEGVDDFLAALVAALQPVEGVVAGVSPACPGCQSRPWALLPGGGDVPASRVGTGGLPRRGRLGPPAAARSRAVVRRAAVPTLAARVRRRLGPGGGSG